MRRAALVAAAGLLPLLAHAADALECSEQRILGTKSGQTATLQLCLPSLRRDPAIVALVERLERLSAQGDDQRRKVEGLVQAMGRTTVELSPAQLDKLAASLARRLPPGPQTSDSTLLRELQRLQLNLDELQERLAPALADPQAAGPARKALAGDVGDLVTRLDFAAAMERLTEVLERRKSACEADPALLAVARRSAEAPYAQLAGGRGPSRCAREWPNLQTLRKAATDAEARRDFATACSAYKDLQDRAERVAGELQYEDQAEQAYRQGYEQLVVTVRSMRDLQHRQARTPQHAAALAQSDAMLLDAETMARNGAYREGMNRLQETLEAYRVAVPNPYSVKLGFTPMPPTPPIPGSLCR